MGFIGDVIDWFTQIIKAELESDGSTRWTMTVSAENMRILKQMQAHFGLIDTEDVLRFALKDLNNKWKDERKRIQDALIEIDYSPGMHVVIDITGEVHTFLAEVVNAEPLVLKVTEDGPFARLQGEDFVLREKDTIALQRDEREGNWNFIRNAHEPPISGLLSLGVTDGKLHQMLAPPEGP